MSNRRRSACTIRHTPSPGRGYTSVWLCPRRQRAGVARTVPAPVSPGRRPDAPGRRPRRGAQLPRRCAEAAARRLSVLRLRHGCVDRAVDRARRDPRRARRAAGAGRHRDRRHARHRAGPARGAPRRDGRRAPAAIVLLSDGATTQGADPLAAAARARGSGSRSTPSRSARAEGVVTDERSGQAIPVPPDPATLREIAARSGGESFEVDDADALDEVYERLGSRIGTRKVRREVSSAFAGGALVLLLGGLVRRGALAPHAAVTLGGFSASPGRSPRPRRRSSHQARPSTGGTTPMLTPHERRSRRSPRSRRWPPAAPRSPARPPPTRRQARVGDSRSARRTRR